MWEDISSLRGVCKVIMKTENMLTIIISPIFFSNESLFDDDVLMTNELYSSERVLRESCRMASNANEPSVCNGPKNIVSYVSPTQSSQSSFA